MHITVLCVTSECPFLFIALTETVNGLLSLHEPFKNVVSYADFVTLSVVVAADEAIKRGGTVKLLFCISHIMF